jgi:hypothetical protein
MRAPETFRKHFESVQRLMNFDRDLVDFALQMVSELRDRLNKGGFQNPLLNVDSTLRALQQVRQNDSLRPRYETIFNQSLVLLVSYFASTMHELFADALRIVVLTNENADLFKEEVKVSIRELRDSSADFSSGLPDILIKTKDISFQDMQSISRAFQTYVNVSLPRDLFTNDIILAQACRHVIVHAGGLADAKFMRQVLNATPRNVKQSVSVGTQVQFTPGEVERVGLSMSQYIEALSAVIAVTARELL